MTAVSRKRKEWEPKQVELKAAIDLRHAALGPRGYKLKPVKTGKSTLLKVQQAQQQAEAMHQVAMDHDMADDDDETAAAPASKRQKAEGVAYRTVSGKVWKDEAEKRASADKNAVLGTSWDKKMREKALRKAFLEQKAAAQDAAKEKRKAAAQHRQAVKDRKKANQEKSAQVQKITNSSTLKKMMKNKKQRKLLRTADTNS